MLIRQETSSDRESVNRVVKAAFETAQHSDGSEHEMVKALRESDAFIPQLSLVAQVDGEIAGHVMFTKAEVDGHTVLALAPLSVLPAFQKTGIGTALVRKGQEVAREMGFAVSVVLGSEKYYPRFGYVPAAELGILPPFTVPSENFMAIKLRQDTAEIQGVIKYAKEIFKG